MIRPLLFACALLALSCGLRGSDTYQVDGVVVSVAAGERKVRIQHEEIPGFMPSMTMDFDVRDPGILSGIKAGDRVRFELERSGTLLLINRIEVIGKGEAGRSGPVDAAPPPERAAPFALVDQRGKPLSLADLRGSAVLLDFIFTRCPGPCPALTQSHVELRQSLAPELRERTRFVSISIDPAHDTPERLLEYAETRGADWPFLTGPPEEVGPVLRAYHVGGVLPENSTDHVLVTYLIDPQGVVVRRYIGVQISPEEITADLRGALDG